MLPVSGASIIIPLGKNIHIFDGIVRIFQSAFEMKFEIRELEIYAAVDLAVVITEENLTQRGYDGNARSQVIATNVFERVGNKWWLVSHHGSPVMSPSGDDTPTLQ